MKTIDITNLDTELKVKLPKPNGTTLLILAIILTVVGRYNVDMTLAQSLGKTLMQAVMLIAFALNYFIVWSILIIAIKFMFPSILTIKDNIVCMKTMGIKVTLKNTRLLVDEQPKSLVLEGVITAYHVNDPVVIRLETENKSMFILVERDDFEEAINSKVTE